MNQTLQTKPVITRSTSSYLVATVPSGTRPNKAHTVRINLYTHEACCSCEAGQHGRRCYHVESTEAVATELGMFGKHEPKEAKRIRLAVIDDYDAFAFLDEDAEFGAMVARFEATRATVIGSDVNFIGGSF